MEFIIGIYTFPLLVKIFLIPFLTFLGVLTYYASREEKNKSVHNLLNGFLSLFGLFLILRAICKIVVDFKTFFNNEVFYDFALPPILTLLYLPFIFCLMIYMSYESVLVTLPRFIKDKRKRIFATTITMVAFNLRIELLERWRFGLSQEDTDTYKGILISIKKIFKMRKAERNPKTISKKQGWSPYIAKNALISQGLETGYYKESYGEWFACSKMIDVGEGLFASNLAYYVEGDEETARILKLVLHVNKMEKASVSQIKLTKVACQLFKYAMGNEPTENLRNALLKGRQFEQVFEIHKVKIEKQPFGSRDYKGYDIKFIISIVKKCDSN